ncbi:MAG TPA: hypothetical protein VFH80_03500 [Solirubrobacteraceae bacterium]|nr:hypothetical protein [Solirubrobacteraceae bacterium]
MHRLIACREAMLGRAKLMWAGVLAVLCAAALFVVLPLTTAGARSDKPVIKTEEVGYYGGAKVTHHVNVYVYSNLGPSAGNHVTVCLGGTCKTAKGHNARLAWYSVSFSTRGLHMGDPVKFTATAKNSAGQSRVSVIKPLLCMHNDGSTPQT